MNPIGSGLSPTLTSVPDGATETPKSAARMQELGNEFESVFLSMLLKEMRQSLDEGFFGSESSDSFGGMFDLFIGKHLAESSPIGVGDMIQQQYLNGQYSKDQYSKGQGTESPQPPSVTIRA